MALPTPLNPSRRIHVGVNAHLLSAEASYRRAGIHQYIYQTLQYLPSGDGRTVTIYTRQMEDWPDRDDLRLVGTRLPTEKRLARIAWEQLVWPVAARRDGLTLMHSMAFAMPRLAPCPTVVTIYDLSFIEFPDLYPVAQRRYLMNETAHSCDHAARLIAISESGRQDIHRLYGVSPTRIDVITPGTADIFRPQPAEEVAAFCRRQSLPNSFFLHVGTLQPRKNIPVLLEALSILNRPEASLVLVGGKGWIYDEIFERVDRLGLRDRVRFEGYAIDEDLPLWYNAATALVLPSLYEGFGMPVVEALACGTPVIASNSSSLPEAGGDVALYFDPHDAVALAGQMARVLDDPTVRRRAQTEGPQHAARFSWPRTGEQLAAVYERAAVHTGTEAAR